MSALPRAAGPRPRAPRAGRDGVRSEHPHYAELHDRAARLGSWLAGVGVRAGDRVALLLHNGLEFPESLLACHRIGACAVPVNFRLAADEIAYILDDSGAAALIAGTRPEGLGRHPVELDAGPAYEAWPRHPVELDDGPAYVAWPRATTRAASGSSIARRT